MGITRASRGSGSGLSFPGSCAMMVVSFLSRGKRAARVVSWSPALRFRSALHHGLVNVAVVDLDSDPLSAELTRGFLGHGDGAVTAAPACDVHAGEHGLHLQGVHCDKRTNPIDVEGDDAIRPGGFQDVGPDLRV